MDPDARELKYYARGQSLILAEEGLDHDLKHPQETFELTRESARIQMAKTCRIIQKRSYS